MLYIHGYDGGAPTRRLTDALRATAPHLFTDAARNRADLTLVPRLQEECNADGWYDLHWSHPRMEIDDLGYEAPRVVQALIGHVRPVGPPPLIPVEQRLADAPPIALDGIGDDAIRLCGGPEQVAAIMEARQQIAIQQHDRGDLAYDWATLAGRLVDMVASLAAPPLTPPQRAHVAVVRLWRAHREVDAARQSMAVHLGNCEGNDYTRMRGLVDAVDPAPVIS
jgi:hypothetical protein